MVKNNEMPAIRFSGYTDAWEQCKLSDITEVIMGQSPSSKNYTDNPNDDILVQGNADLKDGKVVPRLWTKEITKTIDKGGIILTVRAPVGDIAKTDYKVVLGRGVAGIKGNDYIYQFLQKLQYNRYWVSLSSGSTFESINSNDIKDLIIDIPSIEEQTKISMLLNNVNSIITLHQRKLEKLKSTKKALLQKLFPQNESKFPELRFKGFTDTWEQRKLGDVVKSYSGGTPTASNKEYYGGDIPFIRSAEINSDTTELYITQKGLDNSSAKIVEKGTILYAMYGATSGEVGISKINGAINQAILAMIPLEYNGKIIAQYLRKNKESIIGKYLQGGQGNLSANIILELPIQLPGLEESNQIANFLESFDNIITLHQRKLEMLKNVKKGLLQKMFV